MNSIQDFIESSIVWILIFGLFWLLFRLEKTKQEKVKKKSHKKKKALIIEKVYRLKINDYNSYPFQTRRFQEIEKRLEHDIDHVEKHLLIKELKNLKKDKKEFHKQSFYDMVLVGREYINLVEEEEIPIDLKQFLQDQKLLNGKGKKLKEVEYAVKELADEFDSEDFNSELWLQTLHSNYTTRFISDNDRIWTTGGIFITLSLGSFVGFSTIEEPEIIHTVIIGSASTIFLVIWNIVADSHRGFQNKSLAWLSAIEDHIGVNDSVATRAFPKLDSPRFVRRFRVRDIRIFLAWLVGWIWLSILCYYSLESFGQSHLQPHLAFIVVSILIMGIVYILIEIYKE